MRILKEDIECSSEHAVDLIMAVEKLHGMNLQDLSKLLKNSENFIVHLSSEDMSSIQINVERLACSLPLHLIAVLVSCCGDDGQQLIYLLRGVRLLHSLCDLASRNSKLEQVLLEEVKMTEQMLDLVFFLLLILARCDRDNTVGNFALLHSVLVLCSLHLLPSFISSQWHELVLVLLAHPKVDVFMDATFDAVRVGIGFLRMTLSLLPTNLSCKESSSLVIEKRALNICQHSEASLQFLHSLWQQKLFRERLLRNKELCKSGGILSLVLAILKLSIPECYRKSSLGASVSRMKSKVLSILLQLCETEGFSYLDEVASSSKSMELARSVALEALELLKAAFSHESKNHDDFLNRKMSTDLILLNSIRLADIFSDDSNFRSFITSNITHFLTDTLALDPEDFLCSWCSTDPLIIEEETNIDCDPFVFAGVVLDLTCESEDPNSESINESNFGSCDVIVQTPPICHSQHRTSFLVKIIANLHCFVPNICEEREKGQFFNKFLKCLGMEPLKSPSMDYDVNKTSNIFKNLCSLLSHATSLIPNLLNEEDVHLLRVFFTQFQSLIYPPVKLEDNLIQDPVIPSRRDIKATKFEKPYHELFRTNYSNLESSKCRQETLRTTFSNQFHPLELGRSDGHYSSEEAQSIVECSSSLTRKMYTSTRENHSLKDRTLDPNEGFSEATIYQEVDQFTATSNHVESSQNYATQFKECGFRGASHGNEKVEALHSEEKQPKKRKRNIMNEKQISLIEKALLDEPEMQRNSSSVQSWADKLSNHGSEITSSQLKNWLNNRKAKIARLARDARGPSPEKASISGLALCYESPESAGEDCYLPLSKVSTHNTSKCVGNVSSKVSSNETTELGLDNFNDFPNQLGLKLNRLPLKYGKLEPGQAVSLVDAEGKEIGTGKLHQVTGRWDGIKLEEMGMCVVDIDKLIVKKNTKVPHPSEISGTTFGDAETTVGVIRVAWDSDKLFVSSQ